MIHIRAAQLPQEVDAVGEIHYRSRMQNYAGIMPARYLAKQSVAGWQKTWRGIVAAPEFAREHLFVACDEKNRVIGFAHTGPVKPLETETTRNFSGELYALHLREAFQGQGIGQDLLHAVMEWQRAQGRDSMRLWVLTENFGAIRFYERLGAQRSGANWFVCDDEMIEELEYGWTSLPV
ncbi:MAG: GNAT family N-acetyltransferase [Burkholderiaceae bacterium]